MVKGKKVGDIAAYLEPDEMQRLMDVVAGDIYYTTLYKFLKFSGRRTGEVYGLYRKKKLTGGIQVKDIDFERNQFTTDILKTKKRKLEVTCSKCKNNFSYKNTFCPNCGNKLPKIDKEKLKYDVSKRITVSMRPELKTILEIYIKQAKLGKNSFLFREVPLSTIKKRIKQHAKQAHLTKNVSLHSFRKYFITQCKIKGMTNEDIAKWTGHIRAETINIYDSRISEDVRKQIEEVDL